MPAPSTCTGLNRSVETALKIGEAELLASNVNLMQLFSVSTSM
jgi:hypothetical protein